ncbi:hypothetical protein CEXT_651281 [Caerostris extrusa]|uniref:Transposase n=1 Tax=Caerostris extrusa TaxID=172846 RepID=A0AAV4T9X2_CAEEX|nr:hypothetical protein CEXT_651281 [Caerostris extrusa]
MFGLSASKRRANVRTHGERPTNGNETACMATLKLRGNSSYNSFESYSKTKNIITECCIIHLAWNITARLNIHGDLDSVLRPHDPPQKESRFGGRTREVVR